MLRVIRISKNTMWSRMKCSTNYYLKICDLNLSQGEKNMSQGEKYSKSYLFQLVNKTAEHFCPMQFWDCLKVKTREFKICKKKKKLGGAQNKTNSELQFEILCSKTWVRRKPTLSLREGWFKKENYAQSLTQLILKSLFESFFKNHNSYHYIW